MRVVVCAAVARCLAVDGSNAAFVSVTYVPEFVLPSSWIPVRGLQHVDGAVGCLAPARRQQMQFVI